MGPEGKGRGAVVEKPLVCADTGVFPKPSNAGRAADRMPPAPGCSDYCFAAPNSARNCKINSQSTRAAKLRKS